MAVLAIGCALAGGLVGALLPQWISRLPEPELPRGEVKTAYADLARLPFLRPVLAAVTAATFALLAWRLGSSPALPAVLYLAAIGVLLCYVDLQTRLLPNAVILPSYLVVVGLLAGGAAFSGNWVSLAWALGCGAGLWLLFAVTAFIYPAGVGFGDVKLVGLLGLGLGWLGVGYAIVGLVLAFVLGGVVSLGLVMSRRATRKSHLPFGPFLVAGFALSVMFGDELVTWYISR